MDRPVRRPRTLEPATGVRGCAAVENPPKNATVTLVVVERGLENAVAGGENAGRTLIHENAARSWAVLMSAAGGTTAVSLPSDLIRANSSLIGFVQDGSSRQILGAAAVDLE